MSTQGSGSHDPGGHGVQAEDRIHFPKVIAVGVVSLAIFAVATAWAISILHSERASLKNAGEGRMTPQLGKPEIGIVDQVPFQGDTRLDRWKAARADWLNGYGWVDRAHGVIHIPIDRAIEQVLAGSPLPLPPAPAPAASAKPPAPAPSAKPAKPAKAAPTPSAKPPRPAPAPAPSAAPPKPVPPQDSP